MSGALAAFFLAFTSLSSSANAARPEVYSAVIEGDTLGPDEMGPGLGDLKDYSPLPPASKAASVQEKSAPEEKPTKHASKHSKKVAQAKEGKSYDPVPPEQAEAIAARLRIVETMIVKYGRAYDYRNKTTSQLQHILARLERPEHKDEELPPPPALLPEMTEIETFTQ